MLLWQSQKPGFHCIISERLKRPMVNSWTFVKHRTQSPKWLPPALEATPCLPPVTQTCRKLIDNSSDILKSNFHHHCLHSPTEGHPTSNQKPKETEHACKNNQQTCDCEALDGDTSCFCTASLGWKLTQSFPIFIQSPHFSACLTVSATMPWVRAGCWSECKMGITNVCFSPLLDHCSNPHVRGQCSERCGALLHMDMNLPFTFLNQELKNNSNSKQKNTIVFFERQHSR